MGEEKEPFGPGGSWWDDAWNGEWVAWRVFLATLTLQGRCRSVSCSLPANFRHTFITHLPSSPAGSAYMGRRVDCASPGGRNLGSSRLFVLSPFLSQLLAILHGPSSPRLTVLSSRVDAAPLSATAQVASQPFHSEQKLRFSIDLPKVTAQGRPPGCWLPSWE